eukprot:1158737-Pelagomonas_calceolata.AAC.1
MYEQEESIYSLLPPQQEVPARPPRHRSKVCPQTNANSCFLESTKDLRRQSKRAAYRCAATSYTRLQFTGKVDPKTFEFGQDKSLLHATFGLPNGFNAQPPNQFLRSYERAPVLPDRKFKAVDKGLGRFHRSC